MRYDISMLFFIVITACFPVRSADMPVPAEKDLPGAEFLRDEVYVGGALWGLINGGADLYYEYGFDRMALQEIMWKGEYFRVELSRMTSPAGALGIYSVLRHGCDRSGLLVYGDCLNRYQYQRTAGEYYLSLINYSGRPEASELALEIGGLIASKAGSGKEGATGPFAMLSTLPGFPVILRNEYFGGMLPGMKIMKGRLGLQNVLPSLARHFGRLDNYTVYYLHISEGGDAGGVIVICPGEWDEYETESLAGRLDGHFDVIIMEDGNLLGVSRSAGEELQKRIRGLMPAN